MDSHAALTLASVAFSILAIVTAIIVLRAIWLLRPGKNGVKIDNATVNYLSWMLFSLGNMEIMKTLLAQSQNDRISSGLLAGFMFFTAMICQAQRNRDAASKPRDPMAL